MKLKHIYLFACLPLLLFSCKGGDKPAGDEDAAVASQTPVTVTTVNDSSLVDYFDVSATSIFMQKNVVKANANGYIEGVNTQLGHYVAKGSAIFTLKTKE